MFAASAAPATTPPRPHIVRRQKPKVALGPDGPLKNYSKTPDEYADLIAGPHPKVSGAIQRDIIYIIQTKTWGGPVKSEWAKLSLSEFGRACAGADSGAISRALADLVNRGIIATDAPQAEDQPPGALRAKTVTYRYKLSPEKWRDAPPYETPKVTKPAALAPEAEQQSNTAPTPRRRLCDTVTLKPGRKALPTPAAIEPKGATEPVSFRVEFENTGKDPVQVSASSTGDVLTVSVSSCLQAIAESPEKQPLSLPRQSVTKTRNPVGGPAALIETPLAGRFLAALEPLIRAEFGKTLTIAEDGAFVAEIAARIGDLLTPEEFATYAENKFAEKKKLRKTISSGLLIPLANQARDAARADRAAKKTPFPESTMPPLNPDACPECHGFGEDWSTQPQEPGDEGDEARRQWYRAGIPPCSACNGTGKKGGAK